MVILRFDIQSPMKYRDICEEKVHTKRVMGIWSDTKRKLVFSIGEDGLLKVFDITANHVTKEVDVSGTKLTTMVTEPKTGLSFIGDKNGMVYLYDLGVVSFQFLKSWLMILEPTSRETSYLDEH